MRFTNINQNLTLADETRLLAKIAVPFKSELRRIQEAFILISIFRNAPQKPEDHDMTETDMRSFFEGKSKREKWTERTLVVVNDAIDIEFTPVRYESAFAYRMTKEIAQAYCEEINAYKHVVIYEDIRRHIKELMKMEDADSANFKYSYREIVEIAITATNEAILDKKRKRKGADEEQ